jgi:branched-chain amino acid transport system substrate-binding protein
VKDDATNPGTSLQEAESLVSQTHVVALVDGSNVDATWATFAQQNKVPVIGMVSSSEPFFTNSDFFAEGQTEDQLFASIVGAAKKTKAKSMALLYCAEAATCQQGVAPLKTTAKALGVPLVYNASISASSPNYTAQCLAAKQSGASALFIADAVTVIQSVAADCAKQGYTPAIVVDGESLAPAFKTATGLSKNTIFQNLNIPFFASTPAVTTMNNAFKKYQPALMKSKNFNEIAVQGWASGLLFQAAAKAGNLGVNGPPTSAQLLTGLYALKGTTLNGMAPPLTFVSGQPNPVDCWLSYALLKGGTFSSPYGLKSICASKSS